MLVLFFLMPFFSGCSLSDCSEHVKYKTNLLKVDSDGNGIPDNNCTESRKNTYKVHVVMKIREPFKLKEMNDSYQDVRVVECRDKNGYTTIDANIYPGTHVCLTPSAYPLKDLPEELQAYTRPGIATNYDLKMREEVKKIVKEANATTDVQAVESILKWVNDETRSYPPPYDIAEVYYTYLDHGEVKVRNYHFEIPVNILLRTHYFAASMFRERVHGSCSSIATLKCAMIKAAGIPCRLIWIIYPIYYHEMQKEPPYQKKLRCLWDCSNCSFELKSTDDAPSENHAYLEVYLGKRWVRVDEDIDIYNQTPRCLCLKILSVADWSEVDFSKTWPVDWISDRPYYTQLIEDQEP